MKLYLDTSVLVSVFTTDAHSQRADTLLRETLAEMIVSDFAKAEFASVVMRGQRVGAFTASETDSAFAALDGWAKAAPVQISPEDMPAAIGFIRRSDTILRAPDAIHLAIAKRLGASLATFDNNMAKAAALVGVPVLP